MRVGTLTIYHYKLCVNRFVFFKYAMQTYGMFPCCAAVDGLVPILRPALCATSWRNAENERANGSTLALPNKYAHSSHNAPTDTDLAESSSAAPAAPLPSISQS